MTQEVISDFLIKFGFDAKAVQSGLKKVNQELNKIENRIKGVKTTPNIKPRISAEKKIADFTKRQLTSQFAMRLKAEDRFALAKRLSSQQTLEDARREMSLFASNHRKRMAAIKEQARAARVSATGRARAVVGTAVGVAGGVVSGGYGISELKNQENKIKQTGQQFETLVVSAINSFGGDGAMQVLKEGARISQKYGSSLIETSESLINFVALMSTFGDSIDTSVKTFERQQTALNYFGLKQQEQIGFMQQASQAFASNTLDSYQEAFRQWAPRLKADFETFLKNNKGIKDFTEGLTSGKYNLKKLFGEYLSANASRFEQGAKLVSSGSAATEQKALNELTKSVVRVFGSSGFQNALEYSNKLLISFANFLDSNAAKIGKVFEVVNKGLLSASDKLLEFLSKLSVKDIEKFSQQLTQGVSMFYDIMLRLYNFLDKWLPKSAKPATQEEINAAKQRYQSRLESTSNWLNAPSYAPSMMMQQQTKNKVMAQTPYSPNITFQLTVENAQNLNESQLADKLLKRAQDANWQSFRNFTAG